ncbi:MAG: GNAT family N-acetyltransferase [Kineosporiaceae bacterium]|nr:GNAT family N-acetyltransferase [Kineosporiaceae bacterium]
MLVREVADHEWHVVAWMWQCFKHDLAPIVSALPYADGRYATQGLPTATTPDVAGYLALQSHPKTGDPSPVGFAVVEGLEGPRRTLSALWVAPVARRAGVGLVLALDVIGRHVGPWEVAFQHENVAAGRFWRRVADQAFGHGHWVEEQRPVPGLPDVPGDHWIESL